LHRKRANNAAAQRFYAVRRKNVARIDQELQRVAKRLEAEPSSVMNPKLCAGGQVRLFRRNLARRIASVYDLPRPPVVWQKEVSTTVVPLYVQAVEVTF
jgi:hypothetical protein